MKRLGQRKLFHGSLLAKIDSQISGPSKSSSRFQARLDAQARSQPTAKPAQYFSVLLNRPANTSQLSPLFLCLFKGTAQIIGTSGLTPGKFNQELGVLRSGHQEDEICHYLDRFTASTRPG
jgi:hypothetical protein